MSRFYYYFYFHVCGFLIDLTLFACWFSKKVELVTASRIPFFNNIEQCTYFKGIAFMFIKTFFKAIMFIKIHVIKTLSRNSKGVFLSADQPFFQVASELHAISGKS